MNLCKCGCGQEVKKENKYICGHYWKGKYRTNETKHKQSESHKGKIPWNKGKIGFLIHSEEAKQKMRENHGGGMLGKHHTAETKQKWKYPRTKETKQKMSKSSKLTIEKIQLKYRFFSQIEKMRYNPGTTNEKEIQVHCKYRNCINSKERGGWFTPTYSQLGERIRALEKQEGFRENNFYCSEQCKNQCPLYRSRGSLHQTKKPYTQEEYQTFRQFVLNRDDYECQFCGEKATHVHHEKPQKLESFFALDPDYAWSCCKKCHCKYGHKTGTQCSTGNLASKIC